MSFFKNQVHEMFENEFFTAAFSRTIKTNVSKISAFDKTDNIKGTQYEYVFSKFY